MSYILYCREAGFDCNTIVDGATAGEVLTKVRSHAAADHEVDVTLGMEDALRALIKTD